MDDPSVNITRSLKRVLSIEFQPNEETGVLDNNNNAQNIIRDSKRVATESRNVVVNTATTHTENAENDEIIFIEHDETLQNTVNEAALRKNFAALKEVFPEVEESYLLRVLKRFDLENPNVLTMAVYELIANPSKPSKLKALDVILIDTEADDHILAGNIQTNSKLTPHVIQQQQQQPNVPQQSQPKNPPQQSQPSNPNQPPQAQPNGTQQAALSNNEERPAQLAIDPRQANEDIDFLMNIFQNTRQEIVEAVVKRFQKREPNTLQRRNNIIDYIMTHKLNEQPVSSKVVQIGASSAAARGSATNSESAGSRPGTSKDLDQADSIKSDYESITAVINDCEPSYIYDQIKELANHPHRVQVIIDKMLDKKTYPRLKDYLNKVKKQQELDAHINMDVKFEEFLKIYPNPHEYFYDTKKDMSENYKSHCRTLLFNNFKLIARDTLVVVLGKFNWHLTPAFRQLEDAYSASKQVELKFRIEKNNQMYNRPGLHRRAPICMHFFLLLTSIHDYMLTVLLFQK
jgi:hypothetical protein